MNVVLTRVVVVFIVETRIAIRRTVDDKYLLAFDHQRYFVYT